MINTELLLKHIVENKCYVKDIAGQLGLSELAFIKRVGNMADFSVSEINSLCDILHIPREDALNVFFAQ